MLIAKHGKPFSFYGYNKWQALGHFYIIKSGPLWKKFGDPWSKLSLHLSLVSLSFLPVQVRASPSFSPSLWTAALVSSCWATGHCWSNMCWRTTAASTCVRLATTWEPTSASPCTSPSKVRTCMWCKLTAYGQSHCVLYNLCCFRNKLQLKWFSAARFYR